MINRTDMQNTHTQAQRVAGILTCHLRLYQNLKMTKHKWIRNQPVNLNMLASTSVNLWPLIRPEMVLWAPPAGGGDKVSL